MAIFHVEERKSYYAANRKEVNKTPRRGGGGLLLLVLFYVIQLPLELLHYIRAYFLRSLAFILIIAILLTLNADRPTSRVDEEHSADEIF